MSVRSGREIDEVALDDWRATVEANLSGAFLCARAAVRIMRAQIPGGGRIINNGSTFDPAHVAEAVVLMASLPLDVSVPR
jgi:NAD(P)-dependent dehydrogenase (short-subunit alcohol dehydrogenase family)